MRTPYYEYYMSLMNHNELLNGKLLRLFPDKKSRESVSKLLMNYGLESYEPEPSRVRLAVLKLSGTDISEIEKMIKRSKEDYRDILAWAGYPRQSQNPTMPNGSKKGKLIEADKTEYDQWLNT